MGTIADKLTYLNTTKGKIKDSINLTGAGLTNSDTFRSYAKKLKDSLVSVINDDGQTLYNNFPKVSASGSDLTLNDTYESKMSIELKGNTYQGSNPSPSNPQDIEVVTGYNEVRICGKNLFDKDNGNTFNGIFNANTTTINSNSTNKILYIPCKANTTYTIQKLGTTFYVAYSENIPQVGTSIYGMTQNKTITTGNNAKYLVIRYYSTSETTTEQQVLDSIQIEKGSTATTYESYQGNDYEINLGKQLFDKTDTFRLGYINASGVFYAENLTALFDGYIEVKSNTSYIVSANRNLRSIVIHYYDKDKNFLSRNASLDWKKEYKFTTNSNTKYIKLQFSYNATDTMTTEIIDSVDIQIEKGNVATNCAEYFTPIEMCKISNYQDYFVKQNGNWIIPNKILKIDSYNGETITTDYISTTGGLDTGATVYYVGSNDLTITNTELISQLNAIDKAMSYDGQTNITCEYIEGNQPFIIDVSALLNEE